MTKTTFLPVGKLVGNIALRAFECGWWRGWKILENIIFLEDLEESRGVIGNPGTQEQVGGFEGREWSRATSDEVIDDLFQNG